MTRPSPRRPRLIHLLAILPVLCQLALSGCSEGNNPPPTVFVLPTLTASVTATSTLTAIPTATHTPTLTPSVTLTVTPTSTPTVTPTSTLTPTPTPLQGIITNGIGGYLRSGPGVEYDITGEVGSSATFTVRAFRPDADGDLWFLIELPGGQTGWLSWAAAGLSGGAVLDQLTLAATIPPTPTASATPTVTSTPTLPPGADARTVGENGVNLRSGAGLGQARLTTLPPFTPLQLVGRTADMSWFEVMTFDGGHGWVMGELIEVLNPSPENLAINWISVPGGSMTLTSDVLTQVRAIFQRGQNLGNNANDFIMIGDSITVIPQFLQSFAYGNYNLGSYTHLQSVIEAYNQSGSFNANYGTVNHGMTFSMLMDPVFVNPGICPAAAHQLECEVQLNHPSVAIIYLGINDACHVSPDVFERDLNRALQYLIDQGVIPVITTFSNIEQSPCWQQSFVYLARIEQAASTYNLPLIPFRAAAAALPHAGTVEDGTHLTHRADHHSSFAGEEGTLGNTLRELMTLQMLSMLRAAVMP